MSHPFLLNAVIRQNTEVLYFVFNMMNKKQWLKVNFLVYKIIHILQECWVITAMITTGKVLTVTDSVLVETM